MKHQLFYLVIISILSFSCKDSKRQSKPVEVVEVTNYQTIGEEYPNEKFEKTPIQMQHSYSASYDFEKDEIVNVVKSSKRIYAKDYLINISENNVIITEADGEIVEEFKLLEKKMESENSFITYSLDKDGEKYHFSHVIEKDGSYSHFQFRNSDRLNVYLTGKYY